jgi:signal transduction histidine kinase
MTFNTALWAAIAAIITGAVSMWTNPARMLNRSLFFACGHVGCWLFSLFLLSRDGLVSAGWLRVAAILMVAMPVHTVLLQEVLIKGSVHWKAFLRVGRFWLVYFFVMGAWACLLAPTSEQRGLFMLACAFGWGLHVGLALSGLKALRGVRRMEYQIFHLGVVSASAFAIALIAAGAWFEAPVILELMPILVLALCIATTWALTSSKVLDARHILSSVVERLAMVALVVMFVWSVQQLAELFMHAGTAYVLSVSTGLWFAAELHPWLRSVIRQKSRQSQLRKAVLGVVGRELRPEALEDAFIASLKERMLTERAVLLMGSQSRLAGGGLEFPADHPALAALQGLHWVTPELLERKNGLAGAAVLREFMREHQFALVVANPGPTLSFVIALGSTRTGKPYTYPLITRLIEVGTTMENALSRARYLKQTQHAEQLATVGMLGASIAHEIRNPLVTIKTFVQLLPEHHQEATFREKFFRLIGDEVGRIDRLTEQLLDLSAPRVYVTKKVELHSLLGSCVDLISAKAEDKQIKLIKEFGAFPDAVITDQNALKQVILNLSFNGIQALEQRSTDRWIKLKTMKGDDSVEVTVEDSGPGIAPEVYGRLFQPFQSTKSSGFGLGLAICKDILSSVHASITVDPPVQGRGATFRITLPCPRPIS